MALKVPKTAFQTMMKDGSRSFQGMEEAVLRNIDASKELAKLTKTSFGCNGMKKLVVNRNQKVFITNDSATIIKELEVKHPAANIIAMASKMQEEEVGDGSNLVIILCASLLSHAAELLNMGMAACEIIDGYKIAAKKVEEVLPTLVCCNISDLMDISQISPVICTVIGSKQYAMRNLLTDLICQACFFSSSRKEKDFNVDNIRSVKIPGASVESSEFFKGMMFKQVCEGTVKEICDAKISVFTVPFDLMNTETKGTVLLNTAKELLEFTKNEESRLFVFVKTLREAGVNLVVTSDKASDQAVDFANRLGIMVIRLASKFDILRLCRATRATPLPVIKVPTPEECGHCKRVYSTDIGAIDVIVFSEEKEENSLSTIVIRGSSENVMDDVDRAVDDGVNCYKSITRSPSLLPGAGATECALHEKLGQYAKTHSDLKQYAIMKYAEACLTIPKTLAENRGYNVPEMMALLEEQHAKAAADENKICSMGVDIESDKPRCIDAVKAGILDTLYCKARAFQLATSAAVTILAVDQIIMAKTAGGPQFNQKSRQMDED